VKLAVATALLALCAAAYSADATLTPDEQVHCQLQGGCVLVTNDWLRSQIRAAHDAGQREAPCRRPMT